METEPIATNHLLCQECYRKRFLVYAHMMMDDGFGRPTIKQWLDGQEHGNTDWPVDFDMDRPVEQEKMEQPYQVTLAGAELDTPIMEIVDRWRCLDVFVGEDSKRYERCRK